MGLRELSIFAFALKEHWVGGTIYVYAMGFFGARAIPIDPYRYSAVRWQLRWQTRLANIAPWCPPVDSWMTTMFSLNRRHYAAIAFASARRSLGIHTTEKIVVKVALAAAGLFAAWWLGPGASLIGLTIVFLLFVLWYLIRPEPVLPPAPATLDPLYTPAGRKTFRAAQAAISFEIESLKGLVNNFDKSMGKLDLTTESGQEELKRLSDRRQSDNEQLQILLRRPQLRLGYIRD